MNLPYLPNYFDYNATTPSSDEVKVAMIAAMTEYANPSSSSSSSKNVKELIAKARLNVAKLLSVNTESIYFTSGGTESNNWAIKGVLFQHITNPGHIITSAIEHPSVLDTIRYCVDKFGFEVTYLKPDHTGAISVEQVQNAIKKNTQLISLMYANNETGVIQPIEEVALFARQLNIPFHVDAVQFIGKRKIDVKMLNVDFLSLSAHKFYGPKGVGCLYIRDHQHFTPIMHGGGQEGTLRSGTENVMAISGLSKAAEEANELVESWDQKYWLHKQQMMELLTHSDLDVRFNGVTSYHQAMSNTLNISFTGIRAEALAARLEMNHQMVVSLGSACSNNKQKKLSHVLLAMGLNEEVIQGAIRVSFGKYTSSQTIEQIVNALIAEVNALKAISEEVVC